MGEEEDDIDMGRPVRDQSMSNPDDCEAASMLGGNLQEQPAYRTKLLVSALVCAAMMAGVACFSRPNSLLTKADTQNAIDARACFCYPVSHTVGGECKWWGSGHRSAPEKCGLWWVVSGCDCSYCEDCCAKDVICSR